LRLWIDIAHQDERAREHTPFTPFPVEPGHLPTKGRALFATRYGVAVLMQQLVGQRSHTAISCFVSSVSFSPEMWYCAVLPRQVP
jgi:hypothetical protein